MGSEAGASGTTSDAVLGGRVSLRQPRRGHRVGKRQRQSVQCQRAMRVEHAFRRAGCAGGVAKPDRVILVSIEREEWLLGFSQHRLVIVVPVSARASGRGNHDDSFRFEIGRHLRPVDPGDARGDIGRHDGSSKRGH